MLMGARDHRKHQFVHQDPEQVLGWAAERRQFVKRGVSGLRFRVHLVLRSWNDNRLNPPDAVIR